MWGDLHSVFCPSLSVSRLILWITLLNHQQDVCAIMQQSCHTLDLEKHDDTHLHRQQGQLTDTVTVRQTITHAEKTSGTLVLNWSIRKNSSNHSHSCSFMLKDGIYCYLSWLFSGSGPTSTSTVVGLYLLETARVFGTYQENLWMLAK